MNKITPHLLRDLHATLPTGTECYLKLSARKALGKYRKNMLSTTFVAREQAIALLSQRLGRGLKRFLQDDVQAMLPGRQACNTQKLA